MDPSSRVESEIIPCFVLHASEWRRYALLDRGLPGGVGSAKVSRVRPQPREANASLVSQQTPCIANCDSEVGTLSRARGWSFPKTFFTFSRCFGILLVVPFPASKLHGATTWSIPYLLGSLWFTRPSTQEVAIVLPYARLVAG